MSERSHSEHSRTIAGLARRWVDRAATGARTRACDDAVAALRDLSDAEQVLDRLVVGFGLSPFERDLIVLAGLPDDHEVFAELARVDHPTGEPRPSVGTFAAVLDLDAVGRIHLRRALVAGPLARAGIVVATGQGPVPERGWRLASGLWDVVRDAGDWPAACRPFDDPPAVGVSTALRYDVLAAVAGGARLVVVGGGRARPAEESAATVRAALIGAGQGATVHPASQAVGDPGSLLSIHAVARDVVPVVVGTSAEPPRAGHPATVVVCPEPGATVRLDARRTLDLEIPDRTLGDEVAMWSELAPELNGDAAALAGLLRVDALRASHAVHDARGRVQMKGGPLDAASIVRQVRRRSDAQLPPMVRRSTPAVHASRLVTTPDNTALLQSAIDRVRGQVRVLHDWGFRDVGGTRGVRALFSGPPGTGKTLSAEIVAAELGLDLLTVDLSALVSKWLGETEKNIGEVFDAAERCQAVLFFDEADAIFGRRTDAGDAQARWANLETAYLLNRIDLFDGLVVLATNLRANIDDAFVRRLDVVVEFREPGIDERRRLWLGHLPATAPIAADVDVDQLSELYPVTGGVIRNAVLVAAYDAARHETEIDQRLLIDALRREYQKAGRSFPGVPRDLAGIRPAGG